ncbi:uncharacterized protein LOC131947408 [Physella acuta]|uniref:uncharacterized protein LOC131947408 n=1 Tax=Physella acuta TaxID=109671 RepID=UPI0027DABD90|nr:uncharacterized protein LOC131947408 [Physella acuta]
MRVNIEQLTKKQKQNFKNLRKQMSEQDTNVKELNKEIESLKEKRSKSNKTLEKLSLDIKEYENNLLTISKEMQDHADTTDRITQEIKRHSDQMSNLQEESYKIQLNISTQLEKHSLMYKLLQQRLMPIDKLIQIFNQNLETREKRITKLENIEDTISKLSKDLNLIGTFVSPHDGLHLVCVTVHEREDKQIRVVVKAGDEWCTAIKVKCARTSAAGVPGLHKKRRSPLRA